MHIYETIFILDSLMPTKEIEDAIEHFSGIIKDNGGKIRNVDKWGKKRLSYEIQKKQYGFYVVIEFEGPGSIVKTLEGEYNFSDKVLRYLTYRFDKRKLRDLAEKQKKETGFQKEQPETKVKEEKPEPTGSKPEKPAPAPEEIAKPVETAETETPEETEKTEEPDSSDKETSGEEPVKEKND